MKATVKNLLRLCMPLLLAVFMLAVFSLSVFAEQTHVGESRWSLDLQTGILTVDEDIMNYDNTLEFYPPWHDWIYDIREIRILEGVEKIGNFAFTECTNLARVTLPSTLREIGDFAFACCEKLTVVNLPAKVESIYSNSFEGCSALSAFVVDQGNPYYATDAQGVLYNKTMTELLLCPGGFKGTFVVPDHVTVLREFAFTNCTGLTEIRLHEGITRIGHSCFLSCTGLTHITLPNSVKMVEEHTFNLCSGLRTVDLGMADLSSVNAFQNCSALTQITVAAENRHFTCDTQGALYDKSMTSLILCPDGFRGHFTIPEGVEQIAYGAFSACNRLTGVDIPYGVNSIEEQAFYYCTQLEEILLPYSLKRIGNMAFGSCSSIRTISIPDSVYTMGWDIFSDCESLVRVILPDIDIQVEKLDFYGCYDLREVYFRGPAPYFYDEDSKLTIPKDVILYYIEGQEGWNDSVWEEYYTENWSGNIAIDVKEEDYFYDAVQWALDEEITTGVGYDLFRPENPCTRAQVVTFLWRVWCCPEPTTTQTPFKDISPEDYYYKAVLWAAEQGITTGVSEDRFAPDRGCTRAQVVTFLWRAKEMPQSASAQNPFKDVGTDTYYSQAVLWAVEQGITTGKTTESFAPDESCTRGQIVTFLYRAVDHIPNPYAPYYDVIRQIQQMAEPYPISGQGILWDMDGNGIEEFILSYNEAGNHCAIYTIEDGKAVAYLEDHIYIVAVGGSHGECGLAEIDGQRYVYTKAVYYDVERDDVYGAMDYWGVYWKLYLPSENGVHLAHTVDLNYYQAYNRDTMQWYPVLDKCVSRIDGEEKSFADYEAWESSVNISTELHKTDRWYSLEHLMLRFR